MEPPRHYQRSPERLCLTKVHIVTSEFPPVRGGLEQWTRDLATWLCAAGMRVHVYVCGDIGVARHHPDGPFEVIDIDPLRAPWEASLKAAGWQGERLAQERSRMTFVCLRTQIARRTAGGPNLLLSNFVTGVGFTAHLVAEDLGLPHVPVVVGTDFSRGFRNPREREVIAEVCRAARLVVCKSREQATAIARRLPEVRFRVIETSVEPSPYRLCRPSDNRITIFSDIGFSYKKGTDVLLDAFIHLCDHGLDARLELCGADQEGQSEYWCARRRQLKEALPNRVEFPGYLTLSEVAGRMSMASIYANATLGEGASAARARALCLGIPMVTTACGELSDFPGSSHIRMVAVGDADGFRDALLDFTRLSTDSGIVVDDDLVDGFRRRFDPATEADSWLELVRLASADD